MSLPPPPRAPQNSAPKTSEEGSSAEPRPSAPSRRGATSDPESKKNRPQENETQEPRRASSLQNPSQRTASGPDPWSLHQDFLKHLTTIALIMTGGLITLLQSSLMSVRPIYVLPFVPAIISFLVTGVSQWALVRSATLGASEVSKVYHRVEIAALSLLASCISATTVLFLIELGILPTY